MLLFDIHAHLDMFEENEIIAIVERASAAGVKAIINNSIDSNSMRRTLELQQQFGIIKAALGLYPSEAFKLSAKAIDSELEFIKSQKSRFVAIGEIGLDYQEAKDENEKVLEQQLFEKQVNLAIQLGKPVIVHSRKAETEVIDSLIRLGCRKVVLHAFHGSSSLARKAVDAGFFFSIPTNLKRSQQFQGLVKEVPSSRLLTETDSPFLAHEKGQKSEPAHVAITLTTIAAIKRITVEETANILFSNYQQLFI
jgi:TatD DNase family protein